MPTRSLRVIPDPNAELPNQHTNLGLWFQKYFNSQVNEPGQVLIDSITKLPKQVDQVYGHYFNRWVKHLKEIDALTETAKTTGRMVVNLGADSVTEVSIALHHTYGMPYIPGTALKGLAAHYANSNMGAAWKKGTDAYKAIFGTGKTAGYVTFYDALFVPEQANPQPLQKDTVTGHHQNYNKGDNLPPADWDSPTIIPFISVHGKFLIAISGDENAKPVAMEILRLALLNEGIGAKTSSGYGRMVFESLAGDNRQGMPIAELTTPENPEETYDVKKKRLLREAAPEGWQRGDVRNIGKNGDFGFITPSIGGGDVFVHRSALPNGLVEVGQVLEYKPERQPDGRFRAVSVIILLRKE
mgnify:CR=1 FL=1